MAVAELVAVNVRAGVFDRVAEREKRLVRRLRQSRGMARRSDDSHAGDLLSDLRMVPVRSVPEPVEALFAVIAARPSRPAQVAIQDGLSNAAADMEHFSVVFASQTAMEKPSCRRAHDMLRPRDPNAIGVICGKGPLTAPRCPSCKKRHHTKAQMEGRKAGVRCEFH